MIKLKKLYIENFKGIKSKIKVDLRENLESMVVLSGPNGFGKTTVFDALDICLTGQLYRFKKAESFDGVQKNNRGRNKPYYQNQDGSDVILKLWVEDDKLSKSFIIIKHYDDSSGVDRITLSKSNIPHESNQFFTTYLTEDTEYFESNNFSQLQEVSQSNIDHIFFENDSDFTLDSTYYLFNYLQQEENIYFLKKDEDSKGNSLSFLFNIVGEEAKKNNLNESLKKLNLQKETLEKSYLSLKETISSSSDIEYFKLFDTKEFDFDKEFPFKEINDKGNKLKLFNDELNALLLFKTEFDTKEFQKYVHFNYINKTLLGNNELIESLTLKNIYSNEILESIEKKNNQIRKVKEFIESDEIFKVSREIFSWILDEESLQKDFNNYSEYIEQVNNLDKELGSIGRITSDLLESRNKALDDFNLLIERDEINESRCPMCDSPFKTYKELIDSISSKTEALKSYQKVKLEQKNEIVKKIEILLKKLKNEGVNYLKENKEVDDYLITKLRTMPNYSEIISSLLRTYPEIDDSLTSEFYFLTVPKEEEIKRKSISFKEFLTDQLLPKFQYQEELIQNRELYFTYFDNNEESFKSFNLELISKKKEYIKHQYNIEINKQLLFFEKRLEKLEIVRSKVENIYNKVHQSIQAHKKEMIEKIKIPFYIYSGKILQSYQQGLGIFIDIKPTGQSNKVWFKTGNSSDHDIVYHLSSGQMAVVSIAFCLALNKVFNTNENFKFLAIDDPIQTLDDLNVHTFIELLRHDFFDYQILLSTHDDFTSKYIKYKFDKFGAKTQIKNVQQLVLQQLEQ